MTETLLSELNGYMTHPGIIMICSGFIVMFMPEVLRRPLSIAGTAAALWAVTGLGEGSSLTYEVATHVRLEVMYCDSLSMIMLTAALAATAAAAIYGLGSGSRTVSGTSMILAGCSMGTVLAGDFVSLMMFVGLSIPVSAHLVFAGGGERSKGASLRYIISGTAGAAILLTGLTACAFHYGTPVMNMTGIAGETCFILAVLGACLLAAVPPVHFLAPDTMSAACPSGAVFLAIAQTTIGSYLIIRLFAGWQPLVWIGAAAAAFAACMALMENDLRRLTPYLITAGTGVVMSVTGMSGDSGAQAAPVCAAVIMMTASVITMSSSISGKGVRNAATAAYLLASVSISAMPCLALVLIRQGAPGSIPAVHLMEVACLTGAITAAWVRGALFLLPRGRLASDGQETGIPVIQIIAVYLAAAGLAAAWTMLARGTLAGQVTYIAAMAAVMIAAAAIPPLIFIRRISPRV